MPELGNMAAAAEVTGRIMVAAIIVLLVVVIFVLVLHLYAKWFWWQTEEDATTIRRRFEFTPGQETAAAGAQLTAKRGLDASVLKSLEVVVFDPVECKDGLECAVCLCEVVKGDEARMLPKCNHVFHVGCIDMWFESHSTCPLCRNPVVQQGVESGVQMGAALEDGIGNVADVVRSYPTNVLFWGNEVQVSSGSSVVDEGLNVSSNGSLNEASVVDLPRRVLENLPSTANGLRFGEEEQKLPLTTRLRTLKRLLSRDRRVIPSGSSSLDVEQGTSRG